MATSESIKELATALAKAQSTIQNPHKKSDNKHFNSKYADLAEVLDVVRPAMSSNGLSFTQMPSFKDGIVSVETMLMHTSGEWISSCASTPIGKHDPQGVGSAITYLRRYSLAAVAGVAQDDDDGNSASFASAPAAPPTPPKQAPKRTKEETIAVEKGTKLAEDMRAANSLSALDGLYAMAESIENLPQAAADRLAAIYTERTKAIGEGNE